MVRNSLLDATEPYSNQLMNKEILAFQIKWVHSVLLAIKSRQSLIRILINCVTQFDSKTRTGVTQFSSQCSLPLFSDGVKVNKKDWQRKLAFPKCIEKGPLLLHFLESPTAVLYLDGIYRVSHMDQVEFCGFVPEKNVYIYKHIFPTELSKETVGVSDGC